MRFRATFTFVLLLSSVAWAQAGSEPGAGSAEYPESQKSAATTQSTPASIASASSGDSTQLIIIKYRKPDYPIEAARQEIQGRVVIHLVVNENGDVESAEAVSGNPLLADSAIRAMKAWKFKPYIKDGHAVKVSTKMPYDFAFKDKVSDVTADPATPSVLPGPTPAPASDGSSGSNLPQKIRVSQAVSQALLIHRVVPVYPQSAKDNHIQGTVILSALIGTDGHIENLHVVSGPKELQDAAMGAVSLWRYRPYLLNGQPVEVETTIHVNYTLSR